MSNLTAVPIEEGLAAELASAAKAIAAGIERRDALIVRASGEGGSLREIGALVGLTHMGVRDILRRKGGRGCKNCGYAIVQDAHGTWVHDYSTAAGCDDVTDRKAEPGDDEGRSEPPMSETRS